LQVGGHYAIYGAKGAPGVAVPLAGQAFKLAAVNLPFVVGKLVVSPDLPALTLDVRLVALMKVTRAFVRAQRRNPVSSPAPS
jgi:hypothetical protein